MPTPLFDIDICHFSPDRSALEVLDQTLLPLQEQFIQLRTAEEVADAIRRLCVRGAPLIGIAAAMGLCVSLSNTPQALADEAKFDEAFRRNRAIIEASRPTAVNLSWALSRMAKCFESCPDLSPAQKLERLQAEALQIKVDDVATCIAIGNYGQSLIADGMGVLTHCNAGHLATGRYGTALSPIYFAHRQGRRFRVYADETRPLLQGARLTAYELQRSGIDVTLLCDNMAATVMSQGLVQLVLVGCDRVAANGDTANKIGTYGVAVLAHHFGIPFYVCGPKSSFDPACPSGRDIVIEQRSPSEVSHMWYRQPMAPQGCKTLNPSFDVTPHELISGFITEEGILKF